MMKTYDRLADYKRLFSHFCIDRLGSNHPNFPLPLALSCMFFSFFVYHCHMILSKRHHSSILTILLVKNCVYFMISEVFPRSKYKHDYLRHSEVLQCSISVPSPSVHSSVSNFVPALLIQFLVFCLRPSCPQVWLQSDHSLHEAQAIFLFGFSLKELKFYKTYDKA